MDRYHSIVSILCPDKPTLELIGKYETAIGSACSTGNWTATSLLINWGSENRLKLSTFHFTLFPDKLYDCQFKFYKVWISEAVPKDYLFRLLRRLKNGRWVYDSENNQLKGAESLYLWSTTLRAKGGLLDLAVHLNDMTMAKFLLEKGADPSGILLSADEHKKLKSGTLDRRRTQSLRLALKSADPVLGDYPEEQDVLELVQDDKVLHEIIVDKLLEQNIPLIRPPGGHRKPNNTHGSASFTN
ncbi:hypothetical protein BS50DRAFT_591074 [Corynespora cassiicola Philippines]|uniref:Uncharacterized protein n=1 Tax=Corynespora cassiicola Philippines TaxID=1448308 RepID=A0A2T2NFT2_CORCC|nr:hypothetical protein BS50DRAFT_591074 [Corynespora cassiicola Philippines]